MSDITKRALATAFEQLLTRKPYDKITVKDVVETAHVNRQTFYYHFRDLYDLTRWIFRSEAARILSDISLQTWQQSLAEAFSCIMQHRVLILNVFHSPNRDELDQFIHHVSHPLFVSLVANSQRNRNTPPEDCALIAWCYTYALTGMILEWVRGNMKTDPMDMIVQIGRLILGDLKFNLDLGEN